MAHPTGQLPSIDPTLTVAELNQRLHDAQEERTELNQYLRTHQEEWARETTEYRDKFQRYSDLRLEIQALSNRIEIVADITGTGVLEIDDDSTSSSDEGSEGEAMPDVPDKNPGGADLNAIPTFSGDNKVDAEVWINGFSMAAEAFQWKKDSYQQMAAMKFVGDAAIWLEGEVKMRNFPAKAGREDAQDFNAWEMFVHRFLKRWKPQQEPLQATEAIMNLRQASGEGVLAFLDRVVLSVDKKNWQATDRTSADYIAMRDADLFSFGAAGIRTDVRKIILSSTKPPTNFKELKAAAVNAETALRAQHTINEVEEKETEEKKEESSEIAMLRKEIEALKSSNVICYKCGQRGHIRKQCKNQGQGGQQRQGPRGGRGRGRGQPRRPQGRRGGGRGGGYQGGQSWGNNNYQSWQPQANFGQAGNYYQREISQGQTPGRFAYQMGPPPTPHYYPDPRINTLAEEPWMLQGNC